MDETPAQFTERMRKKYSKALETLEQNGPTQLQLSFDKCIAKFLGEKPKEEEKPKHLKLSDILKKY